MLLVLFNLVFLAVGAVASSVPPEVVDGGPTIELAKFSK